MLPPNVLQINSTSTHAAQQEQQRWKPNFEADNVDSLMSSPLPITATVAASNKQAPCARPEGTHHRQGAGGRLLQQIRCRRGSMDFTPSQPRRITSPILEAKALRRRNTKNPPTSASTSSTIDANCWNNHRGHLLDKEETKLSSSSAVDDDLAFFVRDCAPEQPTRFPSIELPKWAGRISDDGGAKIVNNTEEKKVAKEIEVEVNVPTNDIAFDSSGTICSSTGTLSDNDNPYATRTRAVQEAQCSISSFTCNGNFTMDLAPAVPTRIETPRSRQKQLPKKKATTTTTSIKRKIKPSLPDSFFSPEPLTPKKSVINYQYTAGSSICSTPKTTKLDSATKNASSAPPSSDDSQKHHPFQDSSIVFFPGDESSSDSFGIDLYSPEKTTPSKKIVTTKPYDISMYGYEEPKPTLVDNNNSKKKQKEKNGPYRHGAAPLQPPVACTTSLRSHRRSSIDLSSLPSSMKGRNPNKKQVIGLQKNNVRSIQKKTLSFDENIKVHEVSPIANAFNKIDLWFQKNEKKIMKKHLIKAVKGARSGGMDNTFHGTDRLCNRSTEMMGVNICYDNHPRFCLRGIEGYMDDSFARSRDETIDNLYGIVLDTQAIQRRKFRGKILDDVQLASFSAQISEESRRLAVERALQDARMVGALDDNSSTMMKFNNGNVRLRSERQRRRNSAY